MDEEEGSAYLSPSGSVWNPRVAREGSYLYLASIGYWRMLKEWLDDDNDGEISRDELEELVKFYDTLRYRVIVNRTITPEIGLAYRMFVTANTRGKPLNNFDLFRGLVISRAYELEFSDEDVSSLSDWLEKCENSLDSKVKNNKNDDKRSEEIDKIMAYSASVRHGKKIEAKNVATTFEREIRDTIEDLKEMVSIVTDTKMFVKNWDEFEIRREGSDWRDSLSPEYLIYGRLSRLGISQHLPYIAVMRLVEWKDEDIHEFLWLLECFVMRTMVASNVTVGGDIYGLMRFAKQIYDREKASDVLSELAEHLKSRAQTKNPEGWDALSKRQLDKKKAYVILHATEPGLRRTDPRPNTKGLHAYQLMPKFDWSQREWDFTQREKYNPGHDSGRIGNWFLVNGTQGDLNAHTKSMPYRKIAHWKEVGVSETIESLEDVEDSWDASDIEDRTDELVAKCETYWPDTFKFEGSKKK